MTLPDFDWEALRMLVGQFDQLIGRPAVDEEVEARLAMNLRRVLTLLYATGVTMPTADAIYDAAGGDGSLLADIEPTIPDAVTDPSASEVRDVELALRVAASAEALQSLAEDLDREELAGQAARDARAVAASLAEGTRLWDAGRREAGAWEWAFQFDEWGANALEALTSLHGLLWGAGE
ncbi:MAG: hypothetical protein HY876_04060 [Coriobacteriales bacterium]|nr:hypothetical protein [Coriobacteriales bacterium]